MKLAGYSVLFGRPRGGLARRDYVCTSCAPAYAAGAEAAGFVTLEAGTIYSDTDRWCDQCGGPIGDGDPRILPGSACRACGDEVDLRGTGTGLCVTCQADSD